MAMLRKNIYQQVLTTAVAHGGKAAVGFCRIFEAKELDNQLNFVDYVTIPRNASIGLHEHGDIFELYIVLKGRGKMTLGSKVFIVKKGDLIPIPLNTYHSLLNIRFRPLHLAIISTHSRK